MKIGHRGVGGDQRVASTVDEARLRRKEEVDAPRSRMDLSCTERIPPDVSSERTSTSLRSWSLNLARIAIVAFGAAVITAGYLYQHDQAHQAALQNQRLQAEIAGLQATDAERSRTIETLTGIKDAMAARLAASERRLRVLATERDRALDAVKALEDAMQAGEQRLESALQQGADLADELSQTEARLILVSDQHEAAQRSEAGLRWRLASIQTQLERLGARQALAQSWLEGWVLGNLETLEELVAGTGVDVEIAGRARGACRGRPRRPVRGDDRRDSGGVAAGQRRDG